MAILTLTQDRIKDLHAEKDKLVEQLTELRKQTAKSLWLKDLDALKIALDDQDKRDEEKNTEEIVAAGNKAARKATKKPPRKDIKVNKVEPVVEISMDATSMMEADVPQQVKPKGRAAGTKKAPAKKKEDVEDDEDMEPLRARLAAYNLDSSPENSAAMETDDAPKAPPAKKQPSKRAAAKKKPITVEDISDDEDEEQGEARKGQTSRHSSKHQGGCNNKDQCCCTKEERAS
ncbi:DNA topoisomerase 2-like protein [Drosera capensis]